MPYWTYYRLMRLGKVLLYCFVSAIDRLWIPMKFVVHTFYIFRLLISGLSAAVFSEVVCQLPVHLTKRGFFSKYFSYARNIGNVYIWVLLYLRVALQTVKLDLKITSFKKCIYCFLPVGSLGTTCLMMSWVISINISGVPNKCNTVTS